MAHIYAVNKTNTHISLKAGYAIVPASGFLKIHEDDVNHQDFRDAESREWIEYSDTEPAPVAVKGPKIITSSSASAGMSEDELKEMLGQKDEKKSSVIVTSLGKQADTTEKAPETAVDSTESSAEGDQEAAPAKAGRKAK